MAQRVHHPTAEAMIAAKKMLHRLLWPSFSRESCLRFQKPRRPEVSARERQETRLA